MAAYLEHKGVPSEIITMIGKGNGDQRIPTPDNVVEQENRNVHIVLE